MITELERGVCAGGAEEVAFVCCQRKAQSFMAQVGKNAQLEAAYLCQITQESLFLRN